MGMNIKSEEAHRIAKEIASHTGESLTFAVVDFAREAYKTFGKGKHPAKLNLGDCFAYALAKARSEPLLFKGKDFRKTDLDAAV
jgi:ribonuclease VapC